MRIGGTPAGWEGSGGLHCDVNINIFIAEELNFYRKTFIFSVRTPHPSLSCGFKQHFYVAGTRNSI